MVSIIRVVIAAQFDMNDFTYDIAKASIVTGLEPCMGLLAACLPMFPPLFKRIRRGKENPDPRNNISSTVARLRSMKPAFHNMDDRYPLTNLEELGTQNDITGPDSKPESLFEDQNTNVKLESYPYSTMKIKKDWEVGSDEAV